RNALTGASAEEEGKQRLLRVEAVLGLVPYGGVVAVDRARRDLLARMRGQAVEDDRRRRRELQEPRGEAVRLEVAQPLLPLRLLPERDPDVRDEHVRAARRLLWVAHEREVLARRLVPLGTGGDDVGAEKRGEVGERVEHVRSVA